jgi:hypothetical protein
MTLKADPNSKVFPKAAVQKILGDWWDSKTKSPLKKPKPPNEARAKGGNVFDIQPELSSQQAVGILLDLKESLGYEPKPKKVIQRGGYKNRTEFLEKLCGELEKDFKAHYGIAQQSGETLTQETHAHAQA